MNSHPKRFGKLFLMAFMMLVSVHAFAQGNLSNRGKEFWVAWGNNTVTATFVMYISAEDYANISITIPGTSYTISDLILPGEVKSYPRAGIDPPLSSATYMLTAQGLITNKAIHITSDVPVVAYAHQYAGASSAATMLLPVETYGQTYYSLNYTQNSNQSPAYSWFYAVASENNTRIEVTPSANTQGITAGTTVTVDLNKGNIYNVFGTSSGLNGVDVTGSKIQSVAGADGVCHPIGVFSGCSRIVILGTSSGDIMQQQIFPAQAWGTRYLTSPTVSDLSIFTNNNSVFRVAVRDPATVVKRNGIVMTGLVNNFYYEFQSNVGNYIQSDKPILVAQYMPTQGTAGYTGNGDPEMFYLSPIEQGIKNTRFNSTKNQAITSNYINVIVPTISAASLRIDGSPFFDNSYPHPNISGYTIKVKKISPATTFDPINVQHALTCDSTFTAITYGLASVESYGYNAGTLINNLDVLPNIQNTDALVAQETNITCKNTPFKFFVKIGYRATQLKWLFSQVANFSATTDLTINNPVPDDSSVIQGRKYFHYSLPTSYQFSNVGIDTVPIRITAPEIDNCDNSIIVKLLIDVRQGPLANFSVMYTGCKLDTALLHGIPNANGFTLSKYIWTFDDGSMSQSLDTSKFFPTIASHPTKFRVVADNGCSGDTTIDIRTYPNPVTSFGIAPAAICAGSSATFTDTSSFGGSAPITQWYWNFGNGQVITYNANLPRPSTYLLPGDYTIFHTVKASRCASDTVTRMIHVSAKPNINFGFTRGCLQDSTVYFTDSTTLADTQTLMYTWNFGDANANAGNPNTSILQNPSHQFSNYNTNLIKLIVQTSNGCIDSITKPYTVQGFAPTIDFSVFNDTKLCSNIPVKIKSLVNIAQDSIYRVDIYWDAVNQPTTFVSDITPLQDEEYANPYTSFTAPATKQVTIRFVVYSKGGCFTEKTKVITLQAMPTISFPFVNGRCVNVAASSVASATITNGLPGTGTYSGPGVDNAGVFNPALGVVGLNTIKYTYVTNGGCTDSVSQTVRVFPKPDAFFNLGAAACLGDSILIKDSSTIAPGRIAQWQWDFGDMTSTVRNNGSIFYHNYSNAGGFTITLKAISDSGCISADYTKMATVNPLPMPDFTPPPFICMPAGVANFTNLSTIAGAAASTLQYLWNFGDGGTSTVADPTHIYASINSYPVKLTTTSLLGCKKDTTKIVATFYPQPTAAFDPIDTFLCQSTPLLFRDKSSATSSAITNWLWSFGDGTNSTQKNPNKTYTSFGTFPITLVTKSTQGCVSDTARGTIQVNLNPIVTAGQNITISEGQSTMLLGTVNDPAVSVLWSPPFSLNNPIILTPIASPIFTTTYTLIGFGQGGCTDTAKVTVAVLKQFKIPNAFSPNSDGTNDKWEIEYLKDYVKAKIQIFDRYGQVVFESLGYQKPWDGTYKGKPIPVGVYYYVIELNETDYKPLTGSVTLLR